MPFSLNFTHLIEYDAGLSGITLEVLLKLGEKTVQTPVKIDTGSSECVFAREIGEEIGLEIESGQEIYISTATGMFATFRHPVILSVMAYEFDVYAYFAGDENFTRNVLGRHGFLDRIILGLIDYEGKLFLNRYDLS